MSTEISKHRNKQNNNSQTNLVVFRASQEA